MEIRLNEETTASIAALRNTLDRAVELLDKVERQQREAAENLLRCKRYLLENARGLKRSVPALHIVEGEDG
jgi:hypothetical protein